MKNSDKNTLYKFLCMSMPYSPVIRVHDEENGDFDAYYEEISTGGILEVNPVDVDKKYNVYIFYKITDCKPYLRPMSSMNKEEEEELRLLKNALVNCDESNDEKFYGFINEIHKIYYSHHIDMYGLIEKGLAIESPEGMYDN